MRTQLHAKNIDEYDKPLLEVMTDNELEVHNKAVFNGFFSTLKSYDRYLKFVFLTGGDQVQQGQYIQRP